MQVELPLQAGLGTKMKNPVLKTLSTLLLSFLLLSSMSAAEAYASTFTVAPNENATRVVSLNKGDEVYGKVNVVGASNGGIHFYVKEPSGQIFCENENCTQQEFQFFAEKSGDYVFHFDNTWGQTLVTVTFEYNTRRYVFGFPQEMILLFIIVGVLFLAIVAFALSSRH